MQRIPPTLDALLTPYSRRPSMTSRMEAER